jgi:hypothetical protein
MPLHCRGGLIRDIGDNPSPAGEDEKQFRRSTKHILRAYPGLQLEKSKSPRANNNSTQEAAAKNKTGRVLIPLAAVMHRRMAQPSLCPAPALDSILCTLRRGIATTWHVHSNNNMGLNLQSAGTCSRQNSDVDFALLSRAMNGLQPPWNMEQTASGTRQPGSCVLIDTGVYPSCIRQHGLNAVPGVRCLPARSSPNSSKEHGGILGSSWSFAFSWRLSCSLFFFPSFIFPPRRCPQELMLAT